MVAQGKLGQWTLARLEASTYLSLKERRRKWLSLEREQGCQLQGLRGVRCWPWRRPGRCFLAQKRDSLWLRS